MGEWLDREVGELPQLRERLIETVQDHVEVGDGVAVGVEGKKKLAVVAQHREGDRVLGGQRHDRPDGANP